MATKKKGVIIVGATNKKLERMARKNAVNKARHGKACNYNSCEEKDFADMLESMGLGIKVVPG